MLVQYIHLCQCTPAYKWIMFYTYTWFVAHLPINGTCFTHTYDLLCEYIHLCKSTKRTRQKKHSPPKAQDKHNTTKYFILFQCTLTLIKVKSHWAHPVTSQNKSEDINIQWLYKIKVKRITKYFMSHAYKIANIVFGTSCDFTHLPIKTQLPVH